MSIALVCNDLMSGAQISAAAARSGERLLTFSSPAALVAALAGELAAEPPRLVIVDLAAPGLDLGAVIGAARAVGPGAEIVAFGAHVQANRLAAARQAGCDRVLTRGQFFGQIDGALRSPNASRPAGEAENPS